MPPSLYQIVYTSRAAELPQVGAITAVSLKNNGRDGIAGLLVCDRTRYLQAIEGPRQLVNECLSRILADTRHASVDITVKRPIAKPNFFEFKVLCNIDEQIDRTTYIDLIKAQTRLIEDPALQAMFIGFGFMSSLHRDGSADR